jgi:DNA-binding response OmpR family regulator
MRILLVEDEEAIAAVVRQGLEQAGYDVDLAADGKIGLEKAQYGLYALLVLDLMLPEVDGWTICKTVRAHRNTTPILMLTARDEVTDRVRGLEMGADDYLPKPFAFTELLARVQALLRRDRVHKTRTIHVADMEIDTGTRKVTRAGQEITLTPREYDLLEALAANEGRTLSREMIQERVWMDEESLSNTVDVYIGTLRKKMDTGYDARLIHTIHGLGYSLRRPD